MNQPCASTPADPHYYVAVKGITHHEIITKKRSSTQPIEWRVWQLFTCKKCGMSAYFLASPQTERPRRGTRGDYTRRIGPRTSNDRQGRYSKRWLSEVYG